MKEAGVICLPGKKLLDIVTALKPADSSTVKVDAKRAAVITCKKSRFRLGGNDPSVFPDIPAEPEDNIEFDAKLLLKAVERTLFLIRSLSESRFSVKALLIESKDSECAIVGTDGHRMASMVWTQEIPKMSELIAAECATAMAATFDEEGTIAFAKDDNLLWFVQGDTFVVGRKYAGTFPDWRKVMTNNKSKHSLTLKTETFKDCLTRSMICSQSTKDIPSAVRLDFGAGDLSLFGSDVNNGSESEETVEIKYEGKPFQAGFAGTYLTDVLSVIGTDDVKLSFVDGQSAFEFQPVPDDGYKYVVMPRRL